MVSTKSVRRSIARGSEASRAASIAVTSNRGGTPWLAGMSAQTAQIGGLPAPTLGDHRCDARIPE